jgi:hypothetical protein
VDEIKLEECTESIAVINVVRSIESSMMKSAKIGR